MISAVFFACLCTLRPPTEAAETRCVELVLAWHQFARNLLPAHRAALCRPGGATGSSAGHPFPFAFAGGCVVFVKKGVIVDPFGFVLDLLDALEGRAICGGVLLRKAVGVLLNPSPEVLCVEVVLVLDLQFVGSLLGVVPKDRRALDYSDIIKELKARKIIRTKNVLGELGEYLAIQYYNNTPGLPKLQVAPVGTKNIDAISRDGDRYSIKATSSNMTGVFTGVDFDSDGLPLKQYFEYVIICRFDDDFQLLNIYQVDWKNFVKHKKWHSRMKSWNLSLTKDLIADSVIIK